MQPRFDSIESSRVPQINIKTESTELRLSFSTISHKPPERWNPSMKSKSTSLITLLAQEELRTVFPSANEFFLMPAGDKHSVPSQTELSQHRTSTRNRCPERQLKSKSQ